MRKILLVLSMLLGGTWGARACEGACANGLVYHAFGDGRPVTTLAVFVHGDVSSGGAADYMLAYARQFAAKHKNVVAVALLRPEYYDRGGRQSDGSDNGRRDAYTGSNNAMLAGAIRELRAKYQTRRVIALGHSGGAAMLGVVAGNNDGLINGLVLASCPCDIPTWRAGRGGSWPASQSPIDYLPRNTRMIAVAGASDDNTRPILSEQYIAKMRQNGAVADLRLVGGGHNFGGALAGTAISALGAMAR